MKVLMLKISFDSNHNLLFVYVMTKIFKKMKNGRNICDRERKNLSSVRS